MNRDLDAVYLQARSAVEDILDHAGYRLAAESHYFDAFGSAHAEYRGRHERVRLVWDGKDRWLGLSVAKVASSNQHPRSEDFRPLDVKMPSAPSQFLRLGSTTDARVAELSDALVRHLDESV